MQARALASMSANRDQTVRTAIGLRRALFAPLPPTRVFFGKLNDRARIGHKVAARIRTACAMVRSTSIAPSDFPRVASRGARFAGAEVAEADVEALMKSLIMAIVQALVDKPGEVQIKEVIGEHAHVLELRVAKEDLGKVIGKGGAHASAIRTLMAAASGKEKKRYILEIIEY
jgi:predicted RNA-binding protein YlqC (UPF0109 family)